MAWLPRHQWNRQRFGNWQGRSRTFRRRYYNRLWYKPRRRRGYQRRRQLQTRRFPVRRKWMLVRQHNPKIIKPRTIRGWMPALMCYTDAPFFRPMKLGTNPNTDRTGGWTILELTLEAFYKEHLLYRNLWSATNCGYDLARYKGTYMTLYPTTSTDYLVWWDTDYGNFNEFKTLVQHIHPAILINRPNTKVVLSRTTRGAYRPKRIFIPPPSIFKNEWKQMSTWAEAGLAVIAVVAIDFQYPWTHPGYTIGGSGGTEGWKAPYNFNDYAANTHNVDPIIKEGEKILYTSLWWQNKTGQEQQQPTIWAEQWPGWSGEPAVSALNKAVYPAIALGPFVKKDQRSECQIIFTYRSRWLWGGDILTKYDKICDPQTGVPKALRFESVQDPRFCLRKEDIQKDGFIKPEAWERLVAEPREKSQLTYFRGKGEDSEEEEKTEDTIQTETSEDEESGSPERPRRPRGRMDRGRIDELYRLRRLLAMVIDGQRRQSI
nr:ORF1 [Torque teno neovison virus]